MGVPAFYRWLSEKYPKIVEDILEERVKLAGTSTNVPMPFDSTRPNPSGLETDNLYIDMNGIIHPCSHPEHGPQPATEEEMYENVCRYVDRLFRAIRPRKLLYLAIDGVAPRAKMNQQRSRRFRSAQEARELKELEHAVRVELETQGEIAPPPKQAWDSNVITPGTPFMLKLAEYVRFYVRKRVSTDKAWRSIRVIFSDASVPGEGEHKIMDHVRRQRSQPGYDPNTVHCLHGLDADLIMLALATHEAHFYISREIVLFGRKSEEERERRMLESGYKERQRAFDLDAGDLAMECLEENKGKPLQRVSIPTLREYLANEFRQCLQPETLPFTPSLERLIDDVVFLCFFVGNDFLPHLPSLDIRVGALDFLFNVYKRVLPSLGDYITRSGGNVNLSHVDVILAEVGAIEDHVFAMKHKNELRMQQMREERKQQNRGRYGNRNNDAPPLVAKAPVRTKMGRAARILEQQQKQRKLGATGQEDGDGTVALQRGHQAKEDERHAKKAKHMQETENLKAAQALKESLLGGGTKTQEKKKNADATAAEEVADTSAAAPAKPDEEQQKAPTNGATEKEEPKEAPGPDQNGARKSVENGGDDSTGVLAQEEGGSSKRKRDDDQDQPTSTAEGEVGVVESVEDEFEDDADDDDIDDDDDADVELLKVEDIVEEKVVDPEAAAKFKKRIESEQQKKLDDYAKEVEDNVRLHEAGWKDRYYTDKCKADDVSAHGGREHLFRSYVVGLCWVMKYYFEGCPSWKWYFPFHYAPFASDLKNIERFQKDCKFVDPGTPFNPVEQLMAVLPSDSSHAIPKASRWLMLDEESPIIDFYPKDVPVDPNGKAMPWLWVVLLPFIDEDRLLAAMGPTMAKWTATELLCNARGLDDGYLLVSRSHPLARKLATVLEGGKTAKAPKTRLTDASAYGCAGFSGAVRPPLSNEIHPVDEDVALAPPPTADRIDASKFGGDSIFADPIDPNDSVCVAFSEPPKLSHKSILLPGAKVPVPKLNADDKVIRRPRLNRGGGTIANMGMGPNGQSFQSGFGSMNIGSYERQLAEKTGREHQMYQPGTRAWGAMEPTPKRARQPPPPHVQNPFMGQPQPIHQWPGHHRPQQPPGMPPQQQQYRQQQQYQQYQPQRGYGQQYQQGPPLSPPPPPPPQQYPQQPQYGGYQQQQQHQQQWRGGYQQQQQPPPPPQQQGYNFRGFNGGVGNPPRGQWSGGQQQQPPQQRPGGQHQRQGQANADVMSNLKAQLASTLRQNRRPGPGS